MRYSGQSVELILFLKSFSQEIKKKPEIGLSNRSHALIHPDNHIRHNNFVFCARVPEEGQYLEGNDRFEGYSVDLIDGISKMLGFNYEFVIVPDNAYGSFNKKTKKWDGLVKYLLDRVSVRNNIFLKKYSKYLLCINRKPIWPFAT